MGEWDAVDAGNGGGTGPRRLAGGWTGRPFIRCKEVLRARRHPLFESRQKFGNFRTTGAVVQGPRSKTFARLARLRRLPGKGPVSASYSHRRTARLLPA